MALSCEVSAVEIAGVVAYAQRGLSPFAFSADSVAAAPDRPHYPLCKPSVPSSLPKRYQRSAMGQLSFSGEAILNTYSESSAYSVG